MEPGFLGGGPAAPPGGREGSGSGFCGVSPTALVTGHRVIVGRRWILGGGGCVGPGVWASVGPPGRVAGEEPAAQTVCILAPAFQPVPFESARVWLRGRSQMGRLRPKGTGAAEAGVWLGGLYSHLLPSLLLTRCLPPALQRNVRNCRGQALSQVSCFQTPRAGYSQAGGS